MNKVIQYMENVVYPLNAVAQRIAMVVLFLMMMITVVDVTGRVFSSPLYGAYELTGFGLALLIFYSLGYTQLKKGHISISFIVDKWPKKGQAVTDLITYLIFLSLVTVTTWQVLAYAMRLFATNDRTADLGISVYIFVFIASIGLLLFALSLLLDLLKSIQEVVRKDES